MDERARLFEVGRGYRVREDLAGYQSVFVAGEVVISTHSVYSRYDNCHVYQFRTELDGGVKSWWLHDDEPVQLFDRHFSAL